MIFYLFSSPDRYKLCVGGGSEDEGSEEEDTIEAE